jgi:hypothetical protein
MNQNYFKIVASTSGCGKKEARWFGSNCLFLMSNPLLCGAFEQVHISKILSVICKYYIEASTGLIIYV